MSWLNQFRGPNAGSGGGFGAAAVARAKAAGYTDAQIRGEAANAGGAGAAAAAQLNIAPRSAPAPAPAPAPSAAPSTQTAGSDWLKAYTGSQGGGSKGFGAAALQRARSAGHSDADIQSAISSGGYNLGANAQQSLSSGSSVQDVLKGQRNIWAHYNPDGGGGWGAAANTRAIEAGMTKAEIRSQLSESGLYIGDKAAQALNVHTGQTPLKRPKHVQDKIGGYNTRYALLPRDVTAGNMGLPEGHPDREQTGVYVTGGYSDASIANLYQDDNATWEGPHKHGTRGTYQDSDWDYNIGGGTGIDMDRENTYWNNADRDALSKHSDAWRGHGYGDKTPTMHAAGTENLPDSRGWSAAHTAATSAPAAAYDNTFKSAASDIATSVQAEDSVLSNDGPVVDVIDKDPAPTNTIKPTTGSRDYETAAGRGAPRNLAAGISYYSQRFG